MMSSQATTEQPQRVNKRSTTGSDAFVGKQIKIARLEIGVSQTELGEAIGVTFQQIQKYEKRPKPCFGRPPHDDRPGAPQAHGILL